MNNEYQYLDPKLKYSDENGVLYNLAEIKDSKILNIYESLKVAKRVEELLEKPLKIKNSDTLLKIHHHLFQDVYKWAGDLRTVNISKDGKQFFDGERFSIAFKYVDNLIVEYRNIKNTNIKEIAVKLAEILDSINFLHPFREGNGRTQREFLRLLALEKGFILNLNPPDNKNVYEKYMKGVIESDLTILTELITELLKKKNCT